MKQINLKNYGGNINVDDLATLIIKKNEKV